MGKEISLQIDLPDTQIRHLKWKVSITPILGTLKLYSITAEITNSDVLITGKYMQINQQIPSVFNVEKVCEKTGSRKYGIVGPRKKVCYDHQVPRGLTNDEINLVAQNLRFKISEAQKLLEDK